MSVIVYGASDDLIEVEGDIREEFYALADGEPNYLGFSDGTLLSVTYDRDGTWRIRGLSGNVTVEPATDIDTNYSDRATLMGTPTWVVHGKAWAIP